MSSLLSISLFCDSGDTPKVAAQLSRRLLDRSSDIHAFLYDGYTAIDRRKTLSNRDLSISCIMPDPNLSCQIAFLFHADSGRSVPVNIILYGDMFEGGMPIKDCGPIRITTSVNDICRPLWEMNRCNSKNHSLLVESELNIIVLKDIQDLFFTACGLYDTNHSDQLVNHGVMYLEYGCPSPVGSSIIFHKDRNDFLVDYQRIYYEYKLGLSGHALYTGGNGTSSNISKLARMAPCNNLNSEFYKQFDPPSGRNIFNFINNISINEIVKSRWVNCEHFSKWLFDQNCVRLNFTYYDMLDNSLVLIASNPLSSLWECYDKYYQYKMNSNPDF